MEAMAPGGRIAVMGPNFRYCSRDYFDCADHTLVYTHVSIAEHLYAAGFEPARIVPRFLPYSLRGRLPAGARLTRLELRTPALWRLLDKQFQVIGRKDLVEMRPSSIGVEPPIRPVHTLDSRGAR